MIIGPAVILILSTVFSDGYSSIVKCPAGYKTFSREGDRKWCLKFFDGNVTFFDAEKICRCQGGASLSGIENFNEYRWVLDQIDESFSGGKIQNGAIWLGAYRRQVCHGPKTKWEKKEECDKMNMFQWTDRNTVGNKILSKWMPNAPHSTIIGKQQENCVELLYSRDESGLNAKLSGTTNDIICSGHVNAEIEKIRGFLCGRPALVKGISGGEDSCDDDRTIIIGAGKPASKSNN